MNAPDNPPPLWERWSLPAILLASAAIMATNLGTPLIDGMSVKQVYVAQRARHIAAPPFDAFRNTFDIMADDGEPLELVEEIPLYAGLVAAAYAAFGEHEWFGRLFSILATLGATASLYDLVRFDGDRRLALLSAFFLAFTPLVVFYGQAVQPDAAMLCCMLVAACAYRRHLERPRLARWLLACGACVLAAAFKYYGLIVLLPLAVMTLQRQGLRWRGVVAGLALATVAVLPVALWMGYVFARSRNPAANSPYFIFQMPELLARPDLYLRFLDRFLWKDCGPILCVLVMIGVAAVARRFEKPSPMLLGWSLTGVVFFVLLGPMLRYHAYYEMLMLPPAAVWGAIGWRYLDRVATAAWRPLLVAVLPATVIVHSPWVSGANFEREVGELRIARRMEALCGPFGRFAIAGPHEGVVAVHYACRQGWVWYLKVPDDLEKYRGFGAEYLVLVLDRNVPKDVQEGYRRIAAGWPVVEHEVGPWDTKGRVFEYYVLDLRRP